jgi:UDPglucose--hexose-1-phosphate uridylyltransferase
MIRHSELRQDIVSGEWILIAPARGGRPKQFAEKKKFKPASKKGCPFEHPEKAGGGAPSIIHPRGVNWRIQVIPNKYPAVNHREIMAVLGMQGPFFVIPGVGYHDLVVTRGHNKNFPALPRKDAELVLQTFKERYLMLERDRYVSYISIFHNWGPRAGASIYHPHYQIIALPVIPPDVEHSLVGSKKYSNKHRRCVHCDIIKWEKKEGKRIIYENRGAIAFAPFVSREPMEIRVFPKKHLPFFEKSTASELSYVADAMQKALRMVEKKLGYPDYNFFIHTAPVRNRENYRYYHWHIEIQPKIDIEGGFELSTGIEINTIDPDEAAEFLRSK